MEYTESTTYVLSVSDIIAIVGIVINSLLAIWIVKTLQNNLTNKRYLKDHLIEEIKALRTEYKRFFNDLHSGNLKPQKIIPWFKLMNIKVQDTMGILHEKYKIDKDSLKCYQVDFRELVTELEEFTLNFKDNKAIVLQDESLKSLIVFQQKYDSKFNKLIIVLNEK